MWKQLLVKEPRVLAYFERNYLFLAGQDFQALKNKSLIIQRFEKYLVIALCFLEHLIMVAIKHR